MSLYNIVKYYRDGSPSEVIMYDVTREFAKVHCSSNDTQGDGWFHGFTVSDAVEINENMEEEE